MEKDEKRHWHVAYTKVCHERKCCEKLIENGIVAYVPLRKEIRKWSDRNVVKERVLIPQMVFVYVTPQERKDSFLYANLIRFLCEPKGRVPVVIPDDEMNRFRLFVAEYGNEVQFSCSDFVVGDKVQIVEGTLAGITGEVVKFDKNRFRFYVYVNMLGSAFVEFGAEQLAKLTGNESLS